MAGSTMSPSRMAGFWSRFPIPDPSLDPTCRPSQASSAAMSSSPSGVKPRYCIGDAAQGRRPRSLAVSRRVWAGAEAQRRWGVAACSRPAGECLPCKLAEAGTARGQRNLAPSSGTVMRGECRRRQCRRPASRSPRGHGAPDPYIPAARSTATRVRPLIIRSRGTHGTRARGGARVAMAVRSAHEPRADDADAHPRLHRPTAEGKRAAPAASDSATCAATVRAATASSPPAPSHGPPWTARANASACACIAPTNT